jgi:hypothetical protein
MFGNGVPELIIVIPISIRSNHLCPIMRSKENIWFEYRMLIRNPVESPSGLVWNIQF